MGQTIKRVGPRPGGLSVTLLHSEVLQSQSPCRTSLILRHHCPSLWFSKWSRNQQQPPPLSEVRVFPESGDGGVRPVPFAEPSGNSEAWRSLRTALRLARESVADVGLSLSSPDLAQPRTTPPVTRTEAATLGVIPAVGQSTPQTALRSVTFPAAPDVSTRLALCLSLLG